MTIHLIDDIKNTDYSQLNELEPTMNTEAEVLALMSLFILIWGLFEIAEGIWNQFYIISPKERSEILYIGQKYISTTAQNQRLYYALQSIHGLAFTLLGYLSFYHNYYGSSYKPVIAVWGLIFFWYYWLGIKWTRRYQIDDE